MNKLFKKIAVAAVGFAMAIGVGVAVGSNTGVREARAGTETVTLNKTVLNMSSSNAQYTDNTTGFSFTVYGSNNSGIQIRVNNNLHNQVALSGSISNISFKYKYSGSNGTSTITFGTSAGSISSDTINLTGGTTEQTFNQAISGSYTFVSFNATYRNFIITNDLVITYTTGSQATPLDAPTSLNYDDSQNKVTWTLPDSTNTDHCEISFDNGDSWSTTTSKTYHSTSALDSSASYTIKVKACPSGSDASHSDSSATSYTFAILDHAGTEADPYSVSDARALIDTLNGGTAEGKYVTGFICQIDSFNSKYSSITYWISDNGTTSNMLEAYSGKGLDSADFSSIEDIKIAAQVTICGTLKSHNSTYEFDYNNYQVEYTEKAVSSIAVTDSSGKSWKDGETLNVNQLTVVVTYNVGANLSVTDGTGVFFDSGLTETTTTVTEGTHSYSVYYSSDFGTANSSVSITAAASATLSSIAVTTPPSDTVYDVGETFDPTGMVVTATYSDATTNDVTEGCTFAPSGALTKNDTAITISYTYKGVTRTTTQAITVNVVDQYELIKSTDDLIAGCKYLIGGSGDDNGYFISTNQASNNRTATTGTVNNEVVNVTASMQVVTLGGESGAWELIVGDGPNYLYTGSTSSNRLQTTTTLNDNARWSITITNTGLATIHNVGNTSRGQMKYNYNSGSPIFNCYDSGGDLCIYKFIDTAESVSISKSSVKGMKTLPDTSVSITANNFTPTDIQVLYSTANVATVTKGTIEGKNIPLTVNFTGVGTTVATITVLGGADSHEVTLSIETVQKPKTLTLNNATIKEGTIEVKLGASKQISFTATDSDDGDYPISYSGITATSSNTSSVRLSGTTNMVLNGDAIGTSTVTCTITATAEWQTPITQTLTVIVLEDSFDSVKTIAFNENLEAIQGDSPVIGIFATHTGNLHFGGSDDIPLEYFLFSYTSDRSDATGADVFSYDFSHGSVVDSTHKLQTIYVFVTFDENYAGTNYTITVEQFNDPLTNITLSNVTNHAKNITRGETFQLEWVLTPLNPTDGKEVVFSVTSNPSNVSITVNSTGLISVAANSNLGTARVMIKSAHNENISDYVDVTVALESMTYKINEPESWSKASSLSVGDRIVILNETASVELSGVSGNIGNVENYTSNPSGTFILTVGEGNTSGSFTLSNGTDYLAYTKPEGTSKNNNLFVISNPSTADELNQTSWTISFSEGNAIITNVYNTERSIQFNSDRFCCYASSQTAPQIYKLTGGETTMNVDSILYNAVHNNFGEDKTYEWDPTCVSFNSSNWESAGSAFSGASFDNYKLNRAVANANGNEIEQFLAKYDVVIGKFGTDYDFLGRFTEGGINYNNAGRIIPIKIISDNAGTTAVVSIISVTSLAAIGGYFFLRKKKTF